jgi:hypothetical protein
MLKFNYAECLCGEGLGATLETMEGLAVQSWMITLRYFEDKVKIKSFTSKCLLTLSNAFLSSNSTMNSLKFVRYEAKSSLFKAYLHVRFERQISH